MNIKKMSTRALIEYLAKKIQCCSENGGGSDPGTIPNLQQVTGMGNTTSSDINIIGGSSLYSTGLVLINPITSNTLGIDTTSINDNITLTSPLTSGQIALTSQLDEKADLVGGKVPAYQLPSYVDDVVEYGNVAAFPSVGEQGILYISLETNKIYRWSGSSYIDMTPGEADTLNNVVNRGAYSSKPISFLSSTTTPALGDPIGAIGIHTATYSYYWGNFSQAATGLYNISISYGALSKVTSGEYNIGIGVFAGLETTTGKSNTFIGSIAGQKNTTGNFNAFYGRQAGNENTTGYKNTYFGTYAGYNNITSALNTFIGYKSGNANATGDRNLFMGSFSGQGVTGTNNMLLGIGAGYNDGALTNKLIIHNNSSLGGYGPDDTQEGTLSSPTQGNLANGLITGDFSERWVKLNGYLAIRPSNMPVPDTSFTKRVIMNPTTGVVSWEDKIGTLTNTTNVYTTSAELNTAFPNALLGQEIYKDGDLTFFKKVTATKWAQIPLTLI